MLYDFCNGDHLIAATAVDDPVSRPYPHIQIADFGLARPRAYEETLSMLRLILPFLAREPSIASADVRGTVCYLPPEGYGSQGPRICKVHVQAYVVAGFTVPTKVGMPADCWSADVIMYIMLA